MLEWLSKAWCAWVHVGGDVRRDPEGRINWQCRQCGRWSDHPVSPIEEAWVLDTEISAYRSESKEQSE